MTTFAAERLPGVHYIWDQATHRFVRPKQTPTGGKFLKGPLPWQWLV